jgi:hypothetical protein
MKSRINCPFTVSFGTNRQMLLTSLPRCVIALGWSLHSCPAMPLRQTVHTCRVRASSNLLGQSIHFMALANAEFVKPLEPDKKPPGTEMFDRRHPLALRRRRPVTLVQGAVT